MVCAITSGGTPLTALCFRSLTNVVPVRMGGRIIAGMDTKPIDSSRRGLVPSTPPSPCLDDYMGTFSAVHRSSKNGKIFPGRLTCRRYRALSIRPNSAGGVRRSIATCKVEGAGSTSAWRKSFINHRNQTSSNSFCLL